MRTGFTEVRKEIDAMQPELVRIRRDLHRFPETGWLEMRTTAILAKALRAMGYETYTGRAVCKEGARLGLPDEAALAAHAGGRADAGRSRGLHGRGRRSALRRRGDARDAV